MALSQLQQVVSAFADELERDPCGVHTDLMRRAVRRALAEQVEERTDARRVELVQLSDDALRARAAGAGISWRDALIERLADHEARNDVQARVLEHALATEEREG